MQDIRVHLSYFVGNPEDRDKVSETIAKSLKIRIAKKKFKHIKIGKVIGINFDMQSCQRQIDNIANEIYQDRLFGEGRYSKSSVTSLQSKKMESKNLFENDKNNRNTLLSRAGNRHEVLVHLGFIGNKDRISIERSAINSVDFDEPDLNGNQPWQQKIVPEQGIFNELKSDLNFQTIQHKIDQNAFSMCVSFRSSTCLNNFVYYLSLSKLSEIGVDSGLVRMVGSDVIPFEMQQNLVFNLVLEIARQRVENFLKKDSSIFEVMN